MNTHLLALQLMAVQGCLGAFDTIYHHELTEALAQRQSAKRELFIHAVRACLYGVLFIGLSCWRWQGVWALLMIVIFSIEFLLTLWDFVVEDQTRLLPASERITHTLLAVNGGAFVCLLALDAGDWLAAPSGLVWQPNGWLGGFLVLVGIGVTASGVRDAYAFYRLGKLAASELQFTPIQFGKPRRRVLVTGATGFIGQKLVRALLADGQDVIALSRNPRKAAWQFDGKVRFYAGMEDLPLSSRVDVVINLAGARILGVPWTAARKAALLHSRVALTRSVVEWMGKADHRPRLLISASAIGYYGIQKQGDQTQLTENSPPQDIFMSRLCQQWEQAAHGAGKYGVRVMCMRLGVVFGNQGALPMMLLPIRLGMGGRLGSGMQWLSWIHVQDVLRGIAHLWQISEGRVAADAHGGAAIGVYNFTAPQSVTQAEFSRTAANVLHRPCLIPTPAFPMRITLGEQADLLLEGQNVAPTRLQEGGFHFQFPDLRSALHSIC